MGAVATKALADLRRRRLQAFVLATVLLLASAAATLALSILDASRGPFERAFVQATGAHLVIDYAPGVTDAQLAATKTAPGVQASAGPWPVGLARLAMSGSPAFGTQPISGRDRPDGAVDRITLREGRWWERPGEVVLDPEIASLSGAGIGDTIGADRGPGGNGGPPRLMPPGPGATDTPQPQLTLTVVGIAASVSTPGVTAWMSPTDLAALAPDGPVDRQVLYRVDASATDAALAAARAAITAGLPAGAVADTTTWLEVAAGVSETADLYVPVLLAFAVFALLAAAFTIANVVSGIVLTGFRDIGILKAIGFTTLQVTAVLVAEILLPVVVGTAAGIVAGLLASQPAVDRTSRSFGLPGGPGPSMAVALVVGVACVAIACVATAGPAVRAGRLSVVGAVTHGRAAGGRTGGRRLRRLAIRLPLAIPIRLGVAAGGSHPGRALMSLGALVVGVAAVTFATGLDLSLLRVMGQLGRGEASPVRVELMGPAASPGAVTAAIDARGDTARSVAIGETWVAVGSIGSMPLEGYRGDATWIGFAMVHGRWFTGPGEAVASTSVFAELGAAVGDTVDVARDGRSVRLRLVGEVFDNAEESPDHLVLRADWATLLRLDPTAVARRWEVLPEAGVAPRAYAVALQDALAPGVAAGSAQDDTADVEFVLFLSVVSMMGAVLVAISLGGVFNTVLLETRQRTREVAVLKALGLTPAQIVAMVLASVVPLGLLAGLLGLPLGQLFQRAVLSYLGQTAARTAVPDSSFDVFGPALLAGLGLLGVAIAVAGAYPPALRAARARIAPALQAE